jgi:hypothetical protein
MRHRHADGARPNGGVVHDETGHEVLIFAGRYPILQAHPDHFVAGPFGAVPRAVLGCKRIPAVPHALPRPCSASQRAIAAASRLPILSPSFEADPTETPKNHDPGCIS